MQHVSEDLKSRRYKSTISHAIKYMEKYYYTNITLDSISRVTHVSPNYFSKLFKIETGINFIDWLNNLRIEKSLSLLERSDLKIYEVAHQVGYTDYKYYSALFKKSIGVTPRQYRDGQRKR
jgi:two-component system response regulator YesN